MSNLCRVPQVCSIYSRPQARPRSSPSSSSSQASRPWILHSKSNNYSLIGRSGFMSQSLIRSNPCLAMAAKAKLVDDDRDHEEGSEGGILSPKPSLGPHLFIPSKFDIIVHDDDDDNTGLRSESQVPGSLNSKCEDDSCFHMLSVEEEKLVKTPKHLGNARWERDLLFPPDAICIGASHGWVAFFNLFRDGGGGSLFLVNPFTSEKTEYPPFISLPPVETLPFMEALRTCAVPPNPNHSCCSSVSSRHPPLSSEYIGLSRNPRTCFVKFILSSAPSLPAYPFQKKPRDHLNEDCIAVVIGGDKNELAFCRVGETSWHGFGGGHPERGPYSDVIYSSTDRLFYALRGGEWYFPKDGRFHPFRGPDRVVADGEIGDPDTPLSFDDYEFFIHESGVSVEIWDLSSSGTPTGQIWAQAPLPLTSLYEADPTLRIQFCHRRRYLIESCAAEELLLVERQVTSYIDENTNQPYPPCGYRGSRHLGPYTGEDEVTSGRARDDKYTYRTCSFNVYKLHWNWEEHAYHWKPIKCLGDQALIVGLNQSTSLSTIEYPFLKKNSIYFSDDDIEEMVKSDKFGGHDFGIYSFGDGEVGSFIYTDVKKFEQPPVWILPNPV